MKATGKEPSGGTGKLPVGEGAILNWVKGQGGVAIISSDHGKSDCQGRRQIHGKHRD